MKSVSAIEQWLEKYSINNYTISNDLKVSVHGSVNLNGNLELKRLPVTFEFVDGYFDISNNDLTSLEGSPKIVTRDFNCSNNKLESLANSPVKVGDFNCANNRLKNLLHSPKEILGFLNCSNNDLVGINGSPRSIKGYFNCAENKITSLKGGPKYIDSYFDCSDNSLHDLIGGPITVGQDYICNKNLVKELDGVADEIGWDLITDIRLNHLANSHDEETNSWRYKGKEVIAHVYKPMVALSNKEDITRWLSKHEIKNFEILKDNSVNVKGNVRLADRLANLSKLPLSFNIVEGDFDISDNELTSLEGTPKVVKGNFLAFKNEITSLKGGPKEVEGSFIVLKNNVASLKNSPALVKEDFICSHNPLSDLDGINIVQGSVFTGVCIPGLKCQKYVYNSVATYKYSGDIISQYLDKIYVRLTDEERIFEKTRKNLLNAISRLLETGSLKKEMINDMLLKNLTKYDLLEIKEKVLLIKNPPIEKKKEELSESEILKMAFDTEL